MADERTLKSYEGLAKVSLLLACRKCQRKLRRGGGDQHLAKLGKTLKKHAKRNGLARLRVIQTECLDICPKGGVVVCTPRQMVEREFSIVRGGKDLKLLAVTWDAKQTRTAGGPE